MQIQERESVDSKFARGHVNKLLLEVAIDLGLNLIVKLQFSYSGFFFTLKIVRLNPFQVFTLKWFVSSIFLGHHIMVLFTFLLLCML